MRFPWERVRALERRTLLTVDGVPFDVVSVDDGKVEVQVSSGRTYPIYRYQFERAEKLGMVTADVRPGQLRNAGVSQGTPAYVAGIIHAIVGQEPPE